MCTYTKLEVTRDGHIIQSGKIVPPNGVLPYPQNSVPHPRNASAYSEGFNTSLVIVALSRLSDSDQKVIKALYIPKPLHGRYKLKLLLPVATFLAMLYAFAFISYIGRDQSFYFYLVLTIIFAFLVFIPNLWWASGIYYQHGPPSTVIRRIRHNYPSIPIYRDERLYIKDTL